MIVETGKLNLDDFKDGSYSNVSDNDLDQTIKMSMRAHSDLEEIRNDPFYNQTLSVLNNSGSISTKSNKSIKDKEREDFIKGAIKKVHEEEAVKNEIRSIKYEMGKSNINDLTAEWVNEWHRRKQNEITSANIERQAFISESLKATSETDETKPEIPEVTVIEKPARKNKFIRYAYISVAASIIGAALIFETLVPGPTPDKLFNSFYEPYEAISPVMRDGNATLDNYASAITYYKAGDLNKAAYYFELSSKNDPTLRSPVFYLGLTDMANGNYDSAISRFKSIIDVPGIYSKEATWYLGLSYLKKGDPNRAKTSFAKLAESDGYYKERSEDILKRLK